MSFTTRPELRGTFGMVASTHWLATAAGMSVLERGGNAFDAAVATGFTLQVVEPHLNGPGGEVPALLWPVSRGEPVALCGQGVAPAAATIEDIHFRSDSECPVWLNLDWNARVPGGPYGRERWAVGIHPDGATETLAAAQGEEPPATTIPRLVQTGAAPE